MEAATGFVGLGVIISILALGPVIGPYSMSVGAFLAYFLQFVTIVPALVKSFKYTPGLSFKDSGTREFFRLVAPSVVGVAAAEINSIIDSALASTLDSGSVAAMNYAQRINTFAMSLLVTPIITVMFTRFSECAAEKKEDEFSDSMRDGFEAISLLCIPIIALVLVSCTDLVRIVYQRGAFTDESVAMTSRALLFYIAGVVFYGYKTLMNRAFYARKNTKTPMITGFIYIAINIALNYALIGPMGIGGLALANTIALIIATIVMITVYIKQYGRWSMKGSLREFALIFLGTAVCVGLYLLLSRLLSFNLWLRFLVPCAAGGLGYLVIMRIFKVKQFMGLKNMLMGRFKKGKNK